MRILTWNINGIRTIPQYYPWNSFKDHDEILNNLHSDIICFQEVKSSRAALPKSVAVPPSYHSFFSFPVKKTGYSGVAVYSRISTVTPLKAEEGLTGLVQPKTPLGPEERVSRWDNYPPHQEYAAAQSENAYEEDGEVDYQLLDGEGRTLVIDFGLFVLINTYCPNDSSTPATPAAPSPTMSRDKYKKQYHRLLSSRVESLIKNENRQVIVLGDINACAAVIDHCEGDIMVSRARKANNLEKGDESGFWDCEGTGEGRRWLSDWLQRHDGAGGPMVDIVRRFWPERKGMYTCWNTKLSARETNYGTRIDYILVTPGLIPWIEAANIQPEIKGSDHCPVYIDLYDEIAAEDGTSIKLRDVLGNSGEKEPPRLATKFWEEHSGKQMLLDKFFAGKKAKDLKTPDDQLVPLSTANSPQPPPSCLSLSRNATGIFPDSLTATSNITSTITPAPASSSPPHPTTAVPVPTASRTHTSTPSTSSQPRKRKNIPESQSASLSTSKKKKILKAAETKKNGQAKLSSYFDKPPPMAKATKAFSSSATPGSRSTSFCENDIINIDDDDIIDPDPIPASSSPPSSSQNLSALSQSSSHTQTKREKARQTWNSVFLNANDIPKPKCVAHGEPAKEYTVNKQGTNKGKKFWICAR
ncbi:hypothetical protein AGABI1DRAFT_70906 [Agaricus bisporus var. burnettii JB137-S8]|uniref:DNA-(apurinic or apyrimidinic site) endonuclease 2 n=1 Tax=Agaricus bisporus var. burnettii (strain JB137-S8 / ATCC MYA-4627 / FGSC 10392) TaxID=597362 RepID=K5XFR4_AGABU|nr:uncharacterized protein AGABI1DRAFT_70906 [Agaricus bisporus var. burnettii JB137-S8]EKM82253.1 hypothetical protein AGABI1DRAFT_70906 [Agaricus bisporus var. burnettii JB137-S8]